MALYVTLGNCHTSSRKPLTLCVTSFNYKPSMVFSDLLGIYAIFTLLMSRYIPSGLMCQFRLLPYMNWSNMEPLALCVTSFNDEPYIVFPDLLVALCVSLYNIYTRNVSIFPSDLMCHFRQLSYIDWSSMEPLALCVTSFNDELCIVFSNLLMSLCVTLGHCHTWTEAAWNRWPYVSLPSIEYFIQYFQTF